MTFIVTENCNMRCKYCTYDKSNKNMRNHSSKMMSLEVAKASIDFMIQRNNESDFIGLGFYGGEPFLNFPVIKYSVDYLKYRLDQRNGKKNVLLHLTTNGTLLNEEIVHWAIDNDVTLLISLDGPEPIHNRYRVFRDGKGTYKNVINSMNLIRSLDKDYFRRRVSVNMVITPPLVLETLYNWFSEFELIGEIPARVNFVNEWDCPVGSEKFNLGESDLFKQQLHKQFKDLLIDNKIDLKRWFIRNDQRFAISLFGDYLRQIYNRDNANYFTKGYIDVAPCKVGISKFMVNPDGYFFPCPNINDRISDLCFGDIRKELYVNEDILTGYKIMLELIDIINVLCFKCWAQRICRKLCYIYYRENSIQALNDINSLCNMTKNNIKKELCNYFEIEEINENAMHPLELESLNIA